METSVVGTSTFQFLLLARTFVNKMFLVFYFNQGNLTGFTRLIRAKLPA
jgi:hypothetical protein